jgi:hypothetical protein
MREHAPNGPKQARQAKPQSTPALDRTIASAPTGMLALQRTVGNRAVVQMLKAQRSEAVAPVQRMSVRIPTGKVEDFDREQKKMEAYLGENVVDFSGANFSTLNEGETLHLWSHGGNGKFGGMTMEELAAALVHKGLKACKQIILVGCNPRDERFAQDLGTALFQSLQNVKDARPRLPVHATRGTLHGPFDYYDKPGLDMPVVIRTPEHGVIEGERDKEVAEIRLLSAKEKLNTSSIFHSLIDKTEDKEARAAYAKHGKRIDDLEKDIIERGQHQNLLLPPDEHGARKLNPKAVTSFVHPPEQLKVVEQKLATRADLKETDKSIFRDIADFIFRKAVQHGDDLKTQFGGQIEKLLAMSRSDAIKLAQQIQQWCDNREGVVRDKSKR